MLFFSFFIFEDFFYPLYQVNEVWKLNTTDMYLLLLSVNTILYHLQSIRLTSAITAIWPMYQCMPRNFLITCYKTSKKKLSTWVLGMGKPASLIPLIRSCFIIVKQCFQWNKIPVGHIPINWFIWTWEPFGLSNMCLWHSTNSYSYVHKLQTTFINI